MVGKQGEFTRNLKSDLVWFHCCSSFVFITDKPVILINKDVSQNYPLECETHIALLIDKGMQPLVIAWREGHDSVNTTMNIFGHLYPNKQKQVADLLNAEATGEPESNLVDMLTEMRFQKAGSWS